ncbi:MAG TPA: hypothetical protein VD867_07835 [Burkholderiales bacterium]|nr:hypothetical protein [Burkholderiales bacterium]
MGSEPGAVFFHRAQGTHAVAIGGGNASPDKAERAVLQTEGGGVLVKSIQRERDGSFTGEVYGVTPRQRQVAVGDLVTFAEAQIFTFKARDGGAADPAVDEVADMARTFERQFALLDAQSAPESSHPDSAIPEFTLPSDSPAVDKPARAPKRVEPVLTEPPKPAERPKRVEPALPVPPQRVEPVLPVPPKPAERPIPVEPARTDPPKPIAHPTPVEPVRIDPPKPLDQPARVEPVRAEAPAPSEPAAVVEQLGSCVECGAPLTRVAQPADPADPPQKLSKVSCRKCGRINDVAARSFPGATQPSV